ncbi:cation diffusion facilitator family transporter [Streptomyces diacarni]|uniref:Cation diffusion facilitator family transporter n=1 Tax=Streptomyces diacarni TaxID=2800381 RepID=A0A367EHZ1_9ACTN|nr:cation diffusion facilitator family transporter [Streptomyces diacarni]RCG17255.1 cation diffusion facilitator family transporter [Streptomyces diacarni]
MTEAATSASQTTASGAPPQGKAAPSDGTRQDGETKTTVWVALGANLLIAVAKLAGGLVAGSPALLSEAAHSVADSLNEVFLLASLKRSRKPADTAHPFGYGKERFFWSLIAAVGIFVTGGCFSFFQGFEAFTSSSQETLTGYVVGLLVLFLALLAEGTSLVRAVLQVRGQAREARRTMRAEVRHSEDPALRTVLAEDSAACLGVVLAMAGMALHMVTGQGWYEGVASLSIGALLVYVAFVLGRGAKDQLIGVAADPVLRREILDFLDAQPEIDAVTEVLTMRMSPDSVLLAARVDLAPGVESEYVEDALVRVKRGLAERCADVDHVFLDVVDADREDRRRARREREVIERAAEAEAADGRTD